MLITLSTPLIRPRLTQLDIKYSLFLAEEQLYIIKTWMNLQPQENIVQMMHQWQQIFECLVKLGATFEDVYVDTGIVLLDDWNRVYIYGKLDDFFLKLKKEMHHRIDMDKMID